MKAKASNLTPVQLRLVLVGMMITLVIIGVAAFAYGRGVVADYAKASQETAFKAKDSSLELERLKKTKVTLESERATIERASKLVAESQLYVYQDRIIEDISRYANNAGLSITNITFSDTQAIAVGSTPSATTTTSAPATAQPASIKSRTATVTLANPVDYYKLLNFIHSIEEGLFRMRIAKVDILGQNDKGNDVTSDTLTIEVYVR